jgi:hypothetical protein
MERMEKKGRINESVESEKISLTSKECEEKLN